MYAGSISNGVVASISAGGSGVAVTSMKISAKKRQRNHGEKAAA